MKVFARRSFFVGWLFVCQSVSAMHNNNNAEATFAQFKEDTQTAFGNGASEKDDESAKLLVDSTERTRRILIRKNTNSRRSSSRDFESNLNYSFQRERVPSFPSRSPTVTTTAPMATRTSLLSSYSKMSAAINNQFRNNNNNMNANANQSPSHPPAYWDHPDSIYTGNSATGNSNDQHQPSPPGPPSLQPTSASNNNSPTVGGGGSGNGGNVGDNDSGSGDAGGGVGTGSGGGDAGGGVGTGSGDGDAGGVDDSGGSSGGGDSGGNGDTDDGSGGGNNGGSGDGDTGGDDSGGSSGGGDSGGNGDTDDGSGGGNNGGSGDGDTGGDGNAGGSDGGGAEGDGDTGDGSGGGNNGGSGDGDTGNGSGGGEGILMPSSAPSITSNNNETSSESPTPMTNMTSPTIAPTMVGTTAEPSLSIQASFSPSISSAPSLSPSRGSVSSAPSRSSTSPSISPSNNNPETTPKNPPPPTRSPVPTLSAKPSPTPSISLRPTLSGMPSATPSASLQPSLSAMPSTSMAPTRPQCKLGANDTFGTTSSFTPQTVVNYFYEIETDSTVDNNAKAQTLISNEVEGILTTLLLPELLPAQCPPVIMTNLVASRRNRRLEDITYQGVSSVPRDIVLPTRGRETCRQEKKDRRNSCWNVRGGVTLHFLGDSKDLNRTLLSNNAFRGLEEAQKRGDFDNISGLVKILFLERPHIEPRSIDDDDDVNFTWLWAVLGAGGSAFCCFMGLFIYKLHLDENKDDDSYADDDSADDAYKESSGEEEFQLNNGNEAPTNVDDFGAISQSRGSTNDFDIDSIEEDDDF